MDYGVDFVSLFLNLCFEMGRVASHTTFLLLIHGIRGGGAREDRTLQVQDAASQQEDGGIVPVLSLCQNVAPVAQQLKHLYTRTEISTFHFFSPTCSQADTVHTRL